jgi:hypothetical protein
MGREHYKNTIKDRTDAQNGNAVNSIARKRPTKTLSPLFAIESHFGKLAVPLLLDRRKPLAVSFIFPKGLGIHW